MARRILKRLRGALRPAALCLVFLAALAFFAGSLGSLDEGQSQEGLRQLEEALRRGCVACYATEGAYPPDLEYLEEHYGVQVDRERYNVFYDVFAANLMPGITVLENTQ